MRTAYLNNSVCFKSKCFSVEVADSFEKREIGLMGRDYLGESSGMIFVFPDIGVQYFWMKNTKLPLDAIWIDENNKVVYKTNMPPCLDNTQKGELGYYKSCPVYGTNIPVKRVLEVGSGMSSKVNIGDKVDF